MIRPVLRRLARLVIGFLAVVGATTLALLLLASLAGWSLWQRIAERSYAVPERLVLTLDLRGSLADRSQIAPWTLFEPEPPLDLTDTLLALDAAARDPRVRGVVARIDATSHGFAAAQELRDAILRFRASGRFAFVHADSFGGLGPGNEGYFLATAFDRIVLQPEGTLGLTGLALEIPYLGGLLERLGVEGEIVQREEYKTAFETFVARQPSPAQVETLDRLLERVEQQWLVAMAQSRNLAPAALRSLVDGGPWTAQEALAHGLVDDLGHLDEVETEAKARAGGDAELWPLARFAAWTQPKEPTAGTIRVAVVRATGPVGFVLDGGEGIDADELVDLLDQAADDEEVDALLLRLDSPGGAPTAAAAIARAIERLRAVGKPVVVSMENTAASGGYWIAAAADRILALPGTLTGSIGVIAGKPVLARLWQELDVHWARFARGRHAGLASLHRPWEPEERARIEAMVDGLYQLFLAHVATRRELPPERVRTMAGGRVHVGEEALALGLVDALGGVLLARQIFPELLRRPAGTPVQFGRYPRDALDLRSLARLLRRLPWLGEARLERAAPPAEFLAIAPPLRLR
ncbi:Protease 4 [bacterium HR40]|nr:Protease 4 [bacterium HR40]